MKKIFFLGLSLIIANCLVAQVKDPVQWVFTAKKISTGKYEVHLTATIRSGWHLYSQTTPSGGPVATTISFMKNPLLTLTGDAKEIGKLEQHFEELFGVDVKQFSSQVDFVQLVDLKATAKTSLNGSIRYMTCNDKECLPPRIQKFSIAIR
jgi:hypothetical protein